MGYSWSRVYAYGEPPCRDCKRRSPGCHGNCGEYKEWKGKAEEIRHKINMTTMTDNYRISQITKYKYIKQKEDKRR